MERSIMLNADDAKRGRRCYVLQRERRKGAYTAVTQLDC